MMVGSQLLKRERERDKGFVKLEESLDGGVIWRFSHREKRSVWKKSRLWIGREKRATRFLRRDGLPDGRGKGCRGGENIQVVRKNPL